MFDMILYFKFIYNLEKCKCDNPNIPPNCAFTLCCMPTLHLSDV